MRKKSAQQKFVEGDKSKVGAHQLDAMLEAEPRCESGLPPTSARLKGEALEAYQFYVEQLTQSDLAAMPDKFALERACANLAMVWKADRALAREGPVHRVPVMTGRGGARRRVGWRQAKNRWFSVRVEAEKQFHRFAAEFGLTGPASRAGFEVDHPTAEADRELWSLLTMPRPEKKVDDGIVPCT